MGIDIGFASGGFVDDRKEKEVFSKLAEKLEETPSSEAVNDTHIDGKIDIDEDLKVYNEDALQMSKQSIKSERKKTRTFLKRNKRQIFDALIILGVVFVAYKLFWEKEEGMEFESGGDIDYTPTSQVTDSAPVIAPPPPRVEMPEPSYDGE